MYLQNCGHVYSCEFMCLQNCRLVYASVFMCLQNCRLVYASVFMYLQNCRHVYSSEFMCLQNYNALFPSEFRSLRNKVGVNSIILGLYPRYPYLFFHVFIRGFYWLVLFIRKLIASLGRGVGEEVV